MRYDYVLFDLDGTMLDTSLGIVKCLDKTINKFEFTKPDNEKMKRFIGPPLNTSFREAFEIDGEMLDEAIVYFRKEYANGGQFEAKVYDGLFELMEYLKSKGCIIGAATLKYEKFATEILNHFGIAKHLDAICGTHSDFSQPTKKDVLLDAFKKLDIKDKSKVVLIGDSYYDAEGAEQAGIDFIAVSYGFGFTDEYQALLKNHNMIAHSLAEIKQYLED